jgi:DNA-binding HxlR family transcriptional regulator
VPSPIGYQAFCPVGAALNAVGERWALLIVRDLLLGPRRYSELQAGLGGIGTDILAARLRSLQECGVVQRTGHGRERRYELTDTGYDLMPVIRELAYWGAARCKLPSDLSEIPLRVPLTSMLLGVDVYQAHATGVYDLRVEDEAVRFEIEDGHLCAASDAARPAVVISLTRLGLRALLMGTRASEIEANGDVIIEGGVRRGRALLDALSRPLLLAELRSQLAAR